MYIAIIRSQIHLCGCSKPIKDFLTGLLLRPVRHGKALVLPIRALVGQQHPNALRAALGIEVVELVGGHGAGLTSIRAVVTMIERREQRIFANHET